MESQVRRVRTLGLILVLWLVVSLPVALLTGKALKRSREAMEAEPEPPRWVNDAGEKEIPT
jgi:hypothetical protein